MIDGQSTHIALALEQGLLGAPAAEIYGLPGKVRIAAQQEVRADLVRLDIFRRTQEIEDVHFTYSVEMVLEFGFNDFVFTLFNMLYHEAEVGEMDEDGKIIQAYYMRDDNAMPTARMWVLLDDGTPWELRGMALIGMEMDCTARSVVTLHCSFVACRIDQVELTQIVAATQDLRHIPVAAAQAQVFSTDQAWPGDLDEALVPAWQAQVAWKQDAEPCQFGTDGRATRLRVGVQDCAGNLMQLNSLAGYLLEGSLEMRHMIRIDELGTTNWVKFWFDDTLTRIQKQELLDRNALHHTLAFSTRADDETGNAWIQWRRDALTEPFDFAVIRYMWEEAGGTDLDTRTALINTGSGHDGLDIGWNRRVTIPSDESILGGCQVSGAETDGMWLVHGGDNCEQGVEAILIDFNALAQAFPGEQYINIRLRAFWYSTRDSGDITLQFQTYLGGSMQAAGYDFANIEGDTVQEIEVARNVVTQTSADIDGDELGILRYNTITKTAVILAP